jgi:cellulose synthase/poly-beta-1,6-N-acetylglucosamine synthase-like glycosyltransferase
LRVLIGIVAHNEELNIGKVVEFLAHAQPHSSILVVSSGSTDRTDDIVRESMKRFPNVELIIEPERRGRTFALSKLLRRLNERYDVMVYLGADNLPEPGAIEKITQRVAADSKIGMIGGRAAPLNDANTFPGWMANLIWDAHHEISVHEPKVSGELCAIRAGIIYDAPPTMINDDAYLQCVVQMKGYSLAYEPNAVVYLRGPETVRGFFNQRYRWAMGNYQVENFLGGKVPTTYARRNIRIAWGVRRRVGRSKECLWFLCFLGISSMVVAKALIDFHIRKKLPYKWVMDSSTKRLT